MSEIYDFPLTLLDGTPFDTQSLRGQVVLVVNVASRCGFTPQYAELEKLYRELEAQGFVILAFPCNQFGAQEPGSAEEIARFCSLTYGVTFPVMQKIEVNGTHAAPLYRWLKKQKSGLLGSEAIKWNFTKFLIDTRGQVVERYAPQTAPETLRADIIRLLAV
ncbi:glutathione peroxidase [Plesiomonas shigelloides]|uniref:glutathione peroxidase n=1 Tax=Plesiomonas shigelloides TaxID=703 RepID=UPI000D566DA3|nr:glutathione peroxidase [Plesiomonas shigelloides]MCX2497919.1 glutathione peroxidase [Plesiomonas shigelloides]PVU67901.1 glutathione peroxidase [Plesiomonas shigelloides]